MISDAVHQGLLALLPVASGGDGLAKTPLDHGDGSLGLLPLAAQRPWKR
jgi:hypothetical protein